MFDKLDILRVLLLRLSKIEDIVLTSPLIIELIMPCYLYLSSRCLRFSNDVRRGHAAVPGRGVC